MEEGLRLLLDTNIWLELLLGQEKADESRKIFKTYESHELVITDFSFHSIGIILLNLNEHELFLEFVTDNFTAPGVDIVELDIEDINELVDISKRFGLDFDDAYQYTTAEKYGLTIVSFDKDFDRTQRGRKEPGEVI